MRYLVKGNLGWSVGAAWLQCLPIPSRTSQAAFLAIGLSVGRSLDQNALETFSFSSSLPFSLHASRNARHLQAPISNYLTASGAAKSRPPSHTDLAGDGTPVTPLMQSCFGRRTLERQHRSKAAAFLARRLALLPQPRPLAAVPIPDWRTPCPRSLELMLAKE
jgi:hypothetical protein